MTIDLRRYVENKIYPYVENDIKDDLEACIGHIISKGKRSTVKGNGKILTVVGLSGGADSIATLFISKKIGFNPIAVTLDYGSLFYNNDYKKNVKRIAKKLGVKSIFIPINKKYFKIITDSLKNGKKPCKECVKLKVRQLEDICKEMRISFLVIGDMASIKNPIEVINKRLVRVNLPSLFCMDENDMIEASKKLTNENLVYACPVPFILKKYNIKLNDKLKILWIRKLLNWSKSLKEEEILKLLKDIMDS